MKKINLRILISFLGVVTIMISACKKETTVDNAQAANDSNTVSSAIDGLSSDAATSAGQVAGFAGKTEGWIPELLCGASAVDTGTGQTINISYDGSTYCTGFVRSGSITVSLTNGTKWINAQAQLTVVINNIKITTISGNTYTLNGTYTVTNETGGLGWEIAAGITKNATVRHRTQATGVSVTFSDGTQRTWNVDRSASTTSVVSGTNTITARVFSENPTNPGQDTYGTNRYGQAFTTTIADTIISNDLCLYKPYGGQYDYKAGSAMGAITFGTNSTGAVVGTPSTCAPGFFLTYTNGNSNASEYIAYW